MDKIEFTTMSGYKYQFFAHNVKKLSNDMYLGYPTKETRIYKGQTVLFDPKKSTKI